MLSVSRHWRCEVEQQKKQQMARVMECPFFKASGDTSVYCNGFATGINAKFSFETRTVCKKWVKNVCKSKGHCGFGSCPYFLLLEKMCDMK